MGHFDEMHKSHIVEIDKITAKQIKTGLYKMDMKQKWLYLYLKNRKTPVKIKATAEIKDKFNKLDWLYFDSYIQQNYNLKTGNKYKKKSSKKTSSKKKTTKKKSTPKLVTYKHSCADSAKYHQQKYKHWAKKITSVDTTKSTGYAFKGEWLPKTSEVQVPVGSIIIEFRGCSYPEYYLYKMTSSGKKEIAKSSKQSLVNFIKIADKELKK